MRVAARLLSVLFAICIPFALYVGDLDALFGLPFLSLLFGQYALGGNEAVPPHFRRTFGETQDESHGPEARSIERRR